MSQGNSHYRIVHEPTAQEREAAYALRHRVFVEEQNVPVEEEIDHHDPVARHVVILDEAGCALATGRLVIDGSVGKMQRIVVCQTLRGQGLGRLVMEELESAAVRAGARVARLASQIQALGFYERMGYVAHGDIFDDANIPHRWMDKALGNPRPAEADYE